MLLIGNEETYTKKQIKYKHKTRQMNLEMNFIFVPNSDEIILSEKVIGIQNCAANHRQDK